MAAKKVENEAIVIPAIKIETFTVNIIGDTPLISHAWSQKPSR
jgi:hypothetical protein